MNGGENLGRRRWRLHKGADAFGLPERPGSEGFRAWLLENASPDELEAIRRDLDKAEPWRRRFAASGKPQGKP